ncbi:SMI1/KNR4 family protein [Paenibacillus sp. 7523-1]|uniref:SMI1/KNR4 family protein n=1 Tax=Paenibacillus sp. 7523-1 TaxID=2022550 RepID=UPI000BA67828|nr:SMI1/KNR4 family protein [Paenibacillus sp. 7523-1]PAD29263.1 SMI1/KNR4 family protein [Paenibacillus sp. 7523-1]
MESNALEPIRTLLDQAYQTVMGKSCTPELEQAIADFEKKHNVHLPEAYRELLLYYGACNFGDPALYSVQELDWAYPAFVEAYQEYKREYDLSEDLIPFPIGGFGEGSIAVLEQNSGKVLMLIHDYAGDHPFQEVAPHFNGLMEMLAESAIWVQEQMK